MRLLQSEAGRCPPPGSQCDGSQCSSSLPPSPPATPNALLSSRQPALSQAIARRGAWPLLVLSVAVCFCWSACAIGRTRPSPRPGDTSAELAANGSAGGAPPLLRKDELATRRFDASPCPAGWTAGDSLGPNGSARCFRVPRQLATHFECATALCPGSIATGDGTPPQGGATLATLGAPHETRRLFASLGLGDMDLWIGLYRASSLADSPADGNATTQTPPGLAWQWAGGEVGREAATGCRRD